MNGARAKVKPIPERPIAYAVASLFLKYRAVITEKDWYSSAKPIPDGSKGKFSLSKTVSVTGLWEYVGTYFIKQATSLVLCQRTNKGESMWVLTNYHPHADVEKYHTVSKNTQEEASANQHCPSDGGHPGSELGTGHRGNGCCRRSRE